MLLDPAALRRRLPLIIFFVLATMALGAAWAATRTPVYRSTAVVTGPTDLAAIARSGSVADGFRSRVSAAYGADAATTTVAFASASGPRIELATESQFAGVAEDQTSLYVDAVLAARSDVVVEAPATFPLSPRSPNLRRVALLTFLVGTTAGWIAAIALERRSAIGDQQPPSDAADQTDIASVLMTAPASELTEPARSAPQLTFTTQADPTEPATSAPQLTFTTQADPTEPARSTPKLTVTTQADPTEPATPTVATRAPEAAGTAEIHARAPAAPPTSRAQARATPPDLTNKSSRSPGQQTPRIGSVDRSVPPRNRKKRTASEAPRVIKLPRQD